MTSNGFDQKRQLPPFLQDYGSLLSHFQAEFSELTSQQKGDRFVSFTQRLVPHSGIGQEFERPRINPKKTHDEGIDLVADNRTSEAVLYIQAKYTIPGMDAFDTIVSKFEGYERAQNSEPQPSLFPDPGKKPRPKSHYMVVTASDLSSRILPSFQTSKRSARRFFDLLKAQRRIHIIDGPILLQLLQNTYKKSYLLPSELALSFAAPFVSKDNVFIGILPATQLKDLYAAFGNALFLENIREYLGPTSGRVASGEHRITVNEAIADTLENEPQAFLARNNGIAFRAGSVISQDETTLVLRDASIVNGCQTTMSVVQNPRDNCHVLVKVVEASDSWSIAEAANFQNRIDQIALRLARYIRPQAIRAAASKFAVRYDGPEESSAFAVIDTIYQDEITEEQFRALFLGLFSSSPRNVLAVNYTEVNVEVVDTLLSEGNPDRDMAYEILFKLNQITQTGASRLEAELRDNPDVFDLFQRFWKDNKPNYRAFLAILAACGCVKSNVFAGIGRPSYDEIMGFLDSLRTVIDQTPDCFLRYYELAFTSVAIDAIKADQSRDETLQQMKSTIENSNFQNLYLKLQTMATTDAILRDYRHSS